VSTALIRVLLGLATFTVAGVFAVPSAQAPKTVWDGVFTEAQAKQGEVVYKTACVDCHGMDLAGVEQAPALAGSNFKQKWNKATLRQLYDTVDQMPPENPRSLTPKQYTDVLAYLLNANELPAGKVALEADRSHLGTILFTIAKPGK
jgi:mono/diheme cytochrome c family protein